MIHVDFATTTIAVGLVAFPLHMAWHGSQPVLPQFSSANRGLSDPVNMIVFTVCSLMN